MGDQGFDDQFNDGLFTTGFHASVRRCPRQWPKSVSEMRQHTSYEGQGMDDTSESAYSDYQSKRTAPRPLGQFSRPSWNDPSSPRGGPQQLNSVVMTLNPASSKKHPYHTLKSFNPTWPNDLGSNRNAVWHGYLGQKYYDSYTGTWRWLLHGNR